MMPPIDLQVLREQAGGDRALEREVLRLFADDSPNDLARLRSSEEECRMAAHRLVGSARAIGAREVARLAGAVEAGTGDIVALEAAVAEVRAFIAAYLAGDS